jgi:hypothetical protein
MYIDSDPDLLNFKNLVNLYPPQYKAVFFTKTEPILKNIAYFCNTLHIFQ